ncbi:hypothetical protein ACOMHN_014450 [Nucella lapillus]
MPLLSWHPDYAHGDQMNVFAPFFLFLILPFLSTITTITTTHTTTTTTTTNPSAHRATAQHKRATASNVFSRLFHSVPAEGEKSASYKEMSLIASYSEFGGLRPTA